MTATQRPRLSTDGLFEYAAELNRMGFSAELGWHWYVGCRTLPSGERQHFLDRRNVNAAELTSRPKQKPFEGVADRVQTRRWDGD